VLDYIERFYNPTRYHSTLDYLSPMDFERQTVVTYRVSAKPGATPITSFYNTRVRLLLNKLRGARKL
jgi:hypothetical protein